MTYVIDNKPYKDRDEALQALKDSLENHKLFSHAAIANEILFAAEMDRGVGKIIMGKVSYRVVAK